MTPTMPSGPGPEAAFRAFLKAERFMIQRSPSTGAHVFYPRVAAPVSGAMDLEWVEASGLATIYSITINRSKASTHNVAIVELDEGPRMMTNIADVETAPIGTRVKARIVEIDGEPAVVFGLIDGARA